LSSITFKGLKIKVEDFAGIRVEFSNKTLCIDLLNPSRCHYALYTHSHPRHFPQVFNWFNSLEEIVAPHIGLKVKAGDIVRLGSITVEVIEAYNRGELSSAHPKGLGVGYLIRFDDRVTLYHMGDTDLIDEILEIKAGVGILVAPIGGDTVMTPEEASEAVKSLRPTITIPVHFTDLESFYRFRDISQPYTQIVLLRRSRGA